MTERDFMKFIEKIRHTMGSEGEKFAGIMDEIVSTLDSLDSEDILGTEGWRNYFNLD